MRTSIDDILNEADKIVASRGQVKTASEAPIQPDEETAKLANFLLAESEVNLNSAKDRAKTADSEMNIMEKAAHAVALTEVMCNIETFKKIAEFQKLAESKGFSEEQIDKFINEKFAGVQQGLSQVAKALTVPGALLAAGAGVAGHKMGKNKGKKEGYDSALKDVNDAFSQYEGM